MCYSKGYQQTKENPSIISCRQALGCHCLLMYFIIFFSFGCILPSSLLLLIVFPYDFSHASPPSSRLCLFAVSLRWREWKLASDHCRCVANVHYRPLRSATPPCPFSRELKMTCSVYLERVSLHIFSQLPFTQSI